MPDNYVLTACVSLVAGGLKIDDSNANNAGDNGAGIGVTATGGSIVDSLVFLPKLESNN